MSKAESFNPSSGKNVSIQIFRAIAIIAVVMIHTLPSGLSQVYIRPFINFSVATFLFLSGYLTKSEEQNWSLIFKKRIVRVAAPYIIWTFIYSIPAMVNSGGVKFLANLITAKASAPLYYVFVYIQFVLLTPILIRLAKSEYRFIGWIIAPVSILIFKFAGLFFDVEYHRYISLFWSDACLGWFTFYYLGLLLGDQIITIRRRSVKSLCVYYGASLISQMLEGYLFLLHGDSNCGTQLKLSSLLSSTIFLMIIHTVLQNGGFRNRCSSLYDFFILLNFNCQCNTGESQS